jgi:hypothetical protein
MRGDEPDFSAVRSFIVAGGDRAPFFDQPSAQFGLPFRERADGSAILPDAWTHVLAADETAKAGVAMVSLFMGPKRLAPTYHINLGQLQSRLVVPGARSAHSYMYDMDPHPNASCGRVVAMG